MATFDPNTFLEASYTESNDTVTIPIPEGEYIAIVEKTEIRQWQSKDGTKSGLSLDITWNLDSPEVKTLLGREKVQSRQQIMLDLTDAGALDFGKGRNVVLGKLRAALNLNIPGQPFSFPMLNGQLGKVLIKHRVVDENIYAEVKAVAAV